MPSRTTKTAAPDDDICRDDDCPREDLHRRHRVARLPKPRVPRSISRTPPWQRHFPTILRESVLTAVSPHEPRLFHEIFMLVLADYGVCEERTVYRHLHALVQRGEIRRLAVGDRASRTGAYIRVRGIADAAAQTLSEHAASRTADTK